MDGYNAEATFGYRLEFFLRPKHPWQLEKSLNLARVVVTNVDKLLLSRA